MITIKIFKKILKIIALSLIVILLIYGGIYLYAKALPKLPISSANSFYLYDNKKELFEGTNDEWIKIDKISKHLVNATLSVEDKHFYQHNGFDFFRIIKAMFTNVTNRKTLQGASTITQQYAKNLFLGFEKSWKRKIDEAFITMRLEAH